MLSHHRPKEEWVTDSDEYDPDETEDTATRLLYCLFEILGLSISLSVYQSYYSFYNSYY